MITESAKKTRCKDRKKQCLLHTYHAPHQVRRRVHPRGTARHRAAPRGTARHRWHSRRLAYGAGSAGTKSAYRPCLRHTYRASHQLRRHVHPQPPCSCSQLADVSPSQFLSPPPPPSFLRFPSPRAHPHTRDSPSHWPSLVYPVILADKKHTCASPSHLSSLVCAAILPN